MRLIRGGNLAKKDKMLIPIIVVLSVTVIAMILMIFGRNNYADVIEKGVSVNGVNVGKMTKTQAIGVLNNRFSDQLKGRKVKMTYENDIYSISFKALKAHYDINEAVDEAYNYDKNNGIIGNLLINAGLKSTVHNVDLKFTADTSIVEKVVKKISKEIDYAPVDAKIAYVNGNFNITNEKSGLAVDKKKLSDLIMADITPYGADNPIQIPVQEVEAKIKAEALSSINTELSSFTTSFRTSDAARSGNIRIAAGAVDGTVVMPGEIFSMNNAVGPRVASKGYKEAHVIINGELTTGMAGGICQATSTIYNAALLADFPIINRRGHALRVAYVKPSLDATISGDYIDMKFKNNNKYPILIHTIVKDGTVTAKIFGANEHPGLHVVLESQVLEKLDPPAPEYVYDPTLPKGEKVVDSKPIEGMKSVAYRKVYQDGKLISTEILSKDKYKPAREKIRVGTKEN